MATFAELNQHAMDLQGSVHQINTGLQAVRTEIQGLRDQIAAGGVVTQAELDSVDSMVQATQAEAADILSQEGTM